MLEIKVHNKSEGMKGAYHVCLRTQVPNDGEVGQHQLVFPAYYYPQIQVEMEAAQVREAYAVFWGSERTTIFRVRKDDKCITLLGVALRAWHDSQGTGSAAHPTTRALKLHCTNACENGYAYAGKKRGAGSTPVLVEKIADVESCYV